MKQRGNSLQQKIIALGAYQANVRCSLKKITSGFGFKVVQKMCKETVFCVCPEPEAPHI
jgi:hypothetical protein